MDSFLWKMFSEVLCKASSLSLTATRSKLFLIQIIIDCPSIILNQRLQKYFLNDWSFPVSQNSSQHHQYGWLDSCFQGKKLLIEETCWKDWWEVCHCFYKRGVQKVYWRNLSPCLACRGNSSKDSFQGGIMQEIILVKRSPVFLPFQKSQKLLCLRIL